MRSLQHNRRSDIVLARVLGMGMIVLCHTLGFYTFLPGSRYAEQFFNVGVEVFLTISGFLYGTKTIERFGQWFLKRAQRIVIPVAIVSAVDFLVLYFVSGVRTSPSTVIAYLLNLQGLLFVNWDLFGRFFSEAPNLGPLWFTTIIMICYLFVPLFQRFRNSVKGEKKLPVYSAVILSLFAISFLLDWFTKTAVFYFVVFLVGYLLADLQVDKTDFKFGRCVVLCCAIFAALLLRLLTNVYMDGTPLYLCLIPMEYSVIGPSFVCLIMETRKKFPLFFDKLGASKIVTFLDGGSMYIYLVHGIFCRGEYNIYGKTNLFIATVVFIVATTVCAKILWLATDGTNKLLDKAFQNRLPS